MVTREESFLGTSARQAVFQEPKAASERLLGSLQGQQSSQSQAISSVQAVRVSRGQFRDITPIQSRIGEQIQRQVQLQRQKQQVKQKTAQSLKTATVPRMPFRPSIRVPPFRRTGVPSAIPPAISKPRGLGIGKPSTGKARPWSFGMKPRETGLADAVYGAALKKGKPVATGAYGFAIMPRRRRRK
jgi:hypothetical protein